MEANRALRRHRPAFFFFPRAMTDVRERGVGYVPALAHKDPRSGFVALQQRLRHARVFHDHLADFMAAQLSLIHI